jgi:hypothetical protein
MSAFWLADDQWVCRSPFLWLFDETQGDNRFKMKNMVSSLIIPMEVSDVPLHATKRDHNVQDDRHDGGMAALAGGHGLLYWEREHRSSSI